MIPKLMSADVFSFIEILLKILKHQSSGEEESKEKGICTENFLFKDLFTLNYLTIGKGEGPTAIVDGLADIINAESLGEKVIIASANVEKPSSLSFEEQGDHTENYNNVSFDDERGGLAKNQAFSNELKISQQEIVRAGPPSSSLVHFLNSKTHLQSVGGMTSEEVISVEDLAPLKFNDARYLLSVYIQAVSHLNKEQSQGKKYSDSITLPWLLIKCDKMPPQRVSWAYSTIACDENQTGFFRSFLLKECDCIIDYEKECQKLMKDEKGNFSFMSKYDLLGSILTKSGSEKESSTLFIEFAWQEHSSPLGPPPLSADAVAKFKLFLSDPCSPLAAVYLELTRMESITERVEMNHGFWAKIQKTQDENSNIISTIPGFLEELMNVTYEDKNPVKKDEETGDLGSPLLSYVLAGFKRNDMDFTDKLWDFIKNTKSMEEMIVCLDHIFAAICTREVQPVFSTENTTQFAKIIRDFYKSTDLTKASEVLREQLDEILDNSDKILDLMADIGLEKFKKDYTSFFVNEELATFGQLEPVMNKADSLKEKMSVIWKLHYSLELVSIGKAYLKLEIDHLRILLRACLEYFESNQVIDGHPTFSLSIPSVSASALNNLCRENTPETWKLTSVNNNKGKENISMFILFNDDDKHQDKCKDESTLNENESYQKNYRAISVTESKVRIF